MKRPDTDSHETPKTSRANRRDAANGDATPPWQPSQQRSEAAAITRFTRWLQDVRGLDFRDYSELWQWSVDDVEGFWAAIWDFFKVQASVPYERVIGSRDMPGTEWFPGARLNYARHVFRNRENDAIAIRHASESRELSAWTWGQLRTQTAELAAGLRSLGVGPGDVVAAYLPNIPETVAAFLACASIGAVWSSVAPEFGARGVADRLAQIEPKVLFAVDGYRYGGRDFDRREIVDGLRTELHSVEHVVFMPYLGTGALADESMTWDQLRTAGHGVELEFEELPFAHPLWVLYSSGTTGLPKAIVHSQGGILLEHLKVLHFHVDAKDGDRILWFTTTGWMMWNFLMGCLLTPASIVLYDGNPGYPDMDGLWDLAENAGVTCFGTSASYIAACMKSGTVPCGGRDLTRLTAVGSSGSPLPPDAFEWIYEQVGRGTWIFSASGGTDMCTAFVGGVPTLPVRSGELQARSLGAKVEAWDEDGNPLVGAVGELVITEPMPSMPIFFWNDPDGRRLQSAYFDMYPGVWRHGDWIEITERGSAVIHGRSDSTINRGGIRMGTSEIYRAVLTLNEVIDALIVDIPRPGTEGWMPLFVVLQEGASLDDELVATIRRRIRQDCSPRHVPDAVYAILEVPRTLSGKVLEVPVKRILMGHPADQVLSLGSLVNPRSLDYFSELASELSTEWV